MAELGLDLGHRSLCCAHSALRTPRLGAGDRGSDGVEWGVGGGREPSLLAGSLGGDAAVIRLSQHPSCSSPAQGFGLLQRRGPPCTAKGSALYSYRVLHTRANIFLGFFQSRKTSGRAGKSLSSQMPTLMDQQQLPGTCWEGFCGPVGIQGKLSGPVPTTIGRGQERPGISQAGLGTSWDTRDPTSCSESLNGLPRVKPPSASL